MKTAIIYAGGRVGSSMVMGLLKLSDVDVGKMDTTSFSTQNEKGFFEIQELIKEVRDIYPNNLSHFMPSIPIYKAGHPINVNKYFSTYEDVALKLEYGIGLWHIKVDKVIYLTRDIRTQAQSIQNCNIETGDFESWIKMWERFIELNFQYDLKIDFSEWRKDPNKTYLKLYDVVRPPNKLSREEVYEWFEPNLIHYV